MRGRPEPRAGCGARDQGGDEDQEKGVLVFSVQNLKCWRERGGQMFDRVC